MPVPTGKTAADKAVAWAKQRRAAAEKARADRAERRRAEAHAEEMAEVYRREEEEARVRGYAVHIPAHGAGGAAGGPKGRGLSRVSSAQALGDAAKPAAGAKPWQKAGRGGTIPGRGKPGAGGAAGGAAAAPKGKAKVVDQVAEIARRREERRRRAAEEDAARKDEAARYGDAESIQYRRKIRQFREALPPKTPGRPMRAAAADKGGGALRVVVRKRPLSRSERKAKEVFDVVTCHGKRHITIHEPKDKVDLTKEVNHHEFVFDRVLNETSSNSLVYKETMHPLVPKAFQPGGRATIFAYGQTGSGKTFTVSSLIQHTVGELFGLAQADFFALRASVWVSYYELYCDRVFDLLAHRAELKLQEDGGGVVQVAGLAERRADDVSAVLALVADGQASRRTGATLANADSSRSHAVLRLAVRTGDGHTLGQICLVDLAGNERGRDQGDVDRATRYEAAEINKSLLALKECIRAMGSDAAHVPFRDSKLTQVLRDCFIGEHAHSVMIATISPPSTAVDHTLNTMRYAKRLKEIGDHRGSGAAVGGANGGAGVGGGKVGSKGPRGARAKPSTRSEAPPAELDDDFSLGSGSDVSDDGMDGGGGVDDAVVAPSPQERNRGKPEAPASRAADDVQRAARALPGPRYADSSSPPPKPPERVIDGAPKRSAAAAHDTRVPREAAARGSRQRSDDGSARARLPHGDEEGGGSVSPIVPLLKVHSQTQTRARDALDSMRRLLVSATNEEQARMNVLRRGGDDAEGGWAEERLAYVDDLVAMVDAVGADLSALRAAALVTRDRVRVQAHADPEIAARMALHHQREDEAPEARDARALGPGRGRGAGGRRRKTWSDGADDGRAEHHERGGDAVAAAVRRPHIDDTVGTGPDDDVGFYPSPGRAGRNLAAPSNAARGSALPSPPRYVYEHGRQSRRRAAGT